ncbi:MAG: hypothetical protein ACJ786_06045 [Catenulispora sp.]
MSEKPNGRRTPEEYDAMMAELARHMDDEPGPAGGPLGPGDAGDAGGTGGAAGRPGAGTGGPGIVGHWLRAGLALLVALAVTAVLGVYVNFAVALIAGVVLAGVVIYLALRTGYRAALAPDKAADIPLGIGAMLAVLSMAFFAPVFYLSAAGKEGVTTAVFAGHGSRTSISCTATLPNGKTAKVSCLSADDADRLSQGHYRVVYDPDGHTRAWTGTKSDLPVPLGAGLLLGGVAVFAAGALLSVSRAARGKAGWRPRTVA